MRRYMRQAALESMWPAPRDRITLGDLREWHLLGVMCGRCGNARELIPNRLRIRFKDERLLRDLEGRLRCTRCKQLGGHHWTLLRLPR